MNKRLLNPCCDPTFKALFTRNTELSNQALRGFLTAVLGEKVCDVKLIPTEFGIENQDEKDSIFDVVCKIESTGQILNIEMQGRNIHGSYDMRSEYHVAHLLNYNVKKGMDWNEIPQVYQISVLNFIYNKKGSGFSRYTMKNEDNEMLSQRMNIIYMELPKLVPSKVDFGEVDDIEKLTAIQKWGIFFKYAGDKEKNMLVCKVATDENGIVQAVQNLEQISEDEAAWIRETAYWDQVSNEVTARNKAIKEGLAQGLQEGRKQGLEQGLEQGFKNGYSEGVEKGTFDGILKGKIEACCELIKNGILDIETASEKLNLPVEKIEEKLKEF